MVFPTQMFKRIGSILFLKNGLKKKIAEKPINIISEKTIIRYVQLNDGNFIMKMLLVEQKKQI
jgi:hypothetical protein